MQGLGLPLHVSFAIVPVGLTENLAISIKIEYNRPITFKRARQDEESFFEKCTRSLDGPEV